MSDFTRFAIYYLPPEGGDLARFGAHWLGWDVDAACTIQQDPDLSALTETPRKYGFHATIKPPFRLKKGIDPTALADATRRFCAATPPIALAGLSVRCIGGFVALLPDGPTNQIDALAASCVETLDRFRARPAEAELAKRRAVGLTPEQDRNLHRWGYPHVMDEFRFHMTLSSRLVPTDRNHLTRIAKERLPALPQPFQIDELTLVGERKDGRFQTLHRYALSG
ncbi:DUF1045 domain-containing protein [Salibaculum griseiflavum]|uniref:Phosphonate metabolism protein n=1 Tax=Salibaculum griseiflavum TaxID=1914409 RepID=A0A2V1P5K3_9RHOB|nr:DUF1045 domain-containing protein [Salibaculum griseiflavum]PWG17100.1 phosphonate metabolism protein [Salibaculum griseiflavum]